MHVNEHHKHDSVGHENHKKGQGHHSNESKRSQSTSGESQTKEKPQSHSPHRSHSTSSVQGFASKIPVKVTSHLKSYQHICQTYNVNSSKGHHHGDHDEVFLRSRSLLFAVIGEMLKI